MNSKVDKKSAVAGLLLTVSSVFMHIIFLSLWRAALEHWHAVFRKKIVDSLLANHRFLSCGWTVSSLSGTGLGDSKPLPFLMNEQASSP